MRWSPPREQRLLAVGRVAAGAGVCDNELIPDAGSHLDWQDLIGGEAHVSTRVRITR